MPPAAPHRKPSTWNRLASVAVLTLGLLAHTPPAQAMDRDPLDFPLRQYAFLLGIALLGGLVSWYAKVRAGTVHAWSLMTLIGELATSAFAGLLAFWLCAYTGAPQLVTAALVGVAGHMGTRAISAFEQWAQTRFGGPITSNQDPRP
jgi:hypothetical protein